MQQKNREITDFNDIVSVMERCDVCRLALNDDDVPYIIPLNFGMDVTGGAITLYFHSAMEGHKADLIKKDNRASFEMDTKHELQYFEEKGYCTMAFESVIGSGRIRVLDEEEKPDALKAIMRHYHDGRDVDFNPAAIPITLVYALEVEKLTGKRKKPM